MNAVEGRPKYFTGVAVLILLLGFAVRVWNLGEASFWVDEAVTHLRVQKSVLHTLEYLSDNASQGPFYYLLLHLFPRSNELQLRIVSVWAAIIGIALIILAIIRLYRNYDLALVAGMLLAFNPYHVWLSRTARAYSLLFTLALLSSICFLMLLQGNRTRLNWLVFVSSSMAAYVTHHFALVLPLSQYVLFAFILRGNRGFFRRWIRAQLIAAIPLMLYTLRLLGKESVAVGAGWIARPNAGDLFLTLWNMIVGFEGALYWYLVPGLAVGSISFLLGMIFAWRNRRTDRVGFYWLLMVVTTIGAAFAVSILIQPFYVDRYFVVSLPGVLGILATCWSQGRSRRIWALMGGLIAVSGVINLFVMFETGAYEREDWRDAAAYIERERETADGLLVEMPNKLIALLYYLDREIDYAWIDSGAGDLVNLSSQFESKMERLWVVYRNPFEDGHRQNRAPDFDPFSPSGAPMSAWLNQHRESVLRQENFAGVAVLLVDVRAENFGVTP